MNNNFNIKTTDQTVLEYLKCYDTIELEEIQILENLFPMLKTHQFINGSYYTKDGGICRAIQLVPSQKESRAINSLYLGKISFFDDEKEMHFLRSLSALSDVLPFVSNQDRICLNELFSSMSGFKRGIGKIIDINGNKYLPIFNYKKSFLEAQEKTR